MTESTDPRGSPEPPDSFIVRYIRRTRDFGFWRFVFEMVAVAMVLRVPAILLAVAFGESGESVTVYDWERELGRTGLVVTAILIAPPLETLIAQWIPIRLIKRFGGSDAVAVLGSAALFGSLHRGQGTAAVMVMFATGLVLAWSLVVWYSRSRWRGILAPVLIHALLNAIAVGALLLGLWAES